MKRHLNLAISGAVIAVVIVLPLLVFAFARALNSGEIAPNVNVAGIEVGGLGEEDALNRLRAYETRLVQTPAVFAVKTESFTLSPAEVGLDADEETAVAAAMEARRDGSFFDQFSAWIRSFNSPITIEMTTSIDPEALEGVFDEWETDAIGRAPNPGGFSVVDGEIVPEYPEAGEGLDRAAAASLVAESLHLPERDIVILPTQLVVPRITAADVDDAVAEARLVVDGPVTLAATDPEVSITVTAETLLAALRSRVIQNSESRIAVELDPDVMAAALEPFRTQVEHPPRDAEFEILENPPEDEDEDEDPTFTVVLKPSRQATLLDVELVATAVRQVAAGTDTGTLPFRYGEEAEFTTEAAEAMGPITMVSEFTTRHPPGEARVKNIQLFADTIDGTIVWPGETLSLNEAVGERTIEKGYVPAPMILQGEIVDDVGGGVSQFATTFYNAVFFGCYEDVAHTPHSFYFSRYPEGREATISWREPDLVFRNDTDALVIIDTAHTSRSITVRFFGNTGGRTCETETSGRYNYTEPQETFEGDPSIAPGEQVIDSDGWQGWSVTVTRTITEADGTVREEKWAHRYRPGPIVILVHPCELPEEFAEEEIPPCPVAVPGLAGLTFDGAAAALGEVGLTIVDGGTVEVADESQAGLVQSQTPEAGTLLDPESAVTVVIGVYVPPEPPPDDG